MAIMAIIEEEGDEVIIRKLPRPGQEEHEKVLRLASAPGHYLSGMRVEVNEAAQMVSLHLLLAKRIIVPSETGS